MIGFLRGKVAAILTDYCLLDVNGVGYRIYVTGTTRSRLRQGEEAMVYTHMSVREDDISLYGFATQEEYDLFQLLITVSGIGPKVAVGALSAITPERLCQAIAQKQSSVLTKLPGIGKKSAERLILELKDKVKIGNSVLDDTAFEDEEGLFKPAEAIADNVMAEAEAALKSLGYSQQEVVPVLRKLEKDLAKEAKTGKGGKMVVNGKELDAQAIIKLALKEFMKG